MAKKSPAKAPILAPSWVDDMVMPQTLYRALKGTKPLTKILVLACSALKPLLERIPKVDDIFKSDCGHGEPRLSERMRFGINLRDGYFIRAFILCLSNSKKVISIDIEYLPYFKKLCLFGHLRCLT